MRLAVLAYLLIFSPGYALAQGASQSENAQIFELALKCPIKAWVRAATGVHTETVTRHSASFDAGRIIIKTEESEFDFSAVSSSKGKPRTNITINVSANLADIGAPIVQEISEIGARETPKTELLIACRNNKQCFGRSIASKPIKSNWLDRAPKNDRLSEVKIRICDNDSAKDARSALIEILK